MFLLPAAYHPYQETQDKERRVFQLLNHCKYGPGHLPLLLALEIDEIQVACPFEFTDANSSHACNHFETFQ